MHFWTVFPYEHARKLIVLRGTVTEQHVVDARFPLTKWLAKKLPPALASLLKLGASYRYLITIHFDDDAYIKQKENMRIEHILGGTQPIRNDSWFEITKDTRGQFEAGQRVLVTLGLSPTLDQWSTGTLPLRFKLQPIRNERQTLSRT